MRFEEPKMNIKRFARQIVTEMSGTNTEAAENDIQRKANGGFTKVSFGDLDFTL